MDSQFLLDRSHLRAGNGSRGLTEGMEACTEGNGDGGGGARVYTGGGAGGKLRSSRRGFSKKTTPYDRPASGRHATAGGASVSVAASSSSSSSTMASRLMGSASRLISSSASYFFPSFFGRQAIAITNGNLHPEAGVIAEEQDEKEEVESPIKQVIQHGAQQDEKEHGIFDQGRALVTSQAGLEKDRLDVAQVEEMLKQKTWSREQVKRLTDILQTRVIETTTNTHAVETAGRAVDIAGQAVETITGAVDDNTATPISESQRWREELKKARTDFTPIEVARAYMGERTPMPSRLTPSFRGPAHQIDRAIELPPPPGLGLLEDRYRASPVQRSWWTRSPAIRAPKRSSFLDEDWVSVGPVRRTRQKTFQMVNSIPYARGMAPGESAPPRTYTPPPIQSSQTARKILDTLEKLTPSPRGKSLDEKFTAAVESMPMSLTPDTYNTQARKHMQKMEFPRFSNLREPGSSHSKLDFGSMAKSPMNSPTLTLGAVKESNSEEKSQVNLRLPSSSEAGFPNLASSKSSRGSMATSLPCNTEANAPVTILALSSAITVTSSGSPAAAPLPAAGSHSQNVSSSSSAAVPTQPESKPLFSWSHGPNFSFSSAATENRWAMSSSPPGGSLAMPAWPTPVSTPATVALPAVFMTPVTHALSTAAAPSLVSSAREQHSEGDKGVATEAQVTMKAPEGSIVESNTFVKEPDKSSNSSGSNPFQFGSPISGSTFSFKIGHNSSPFSVVGAQSSVGLAFPLRAQSVTLASKSSSSFSKTAHSAPSTMFGSLPASVSDPSSFSVMTTAASSTPLPAQSNPFPLLKPSAAGQLFSGSQITKPTAILSLTIEASNASFTFSSSPAPVSCSTPTFPFGSISSAPLASSSSSAGQFLAYNAHPTALEASSSSPAGASNSGPVFSFTSPSGEPKLPALSFGSNDISLPTPTFTFGSGALPLSSSTGSLTVGGQTSSSSSCGQLFGSATGLASGPYSSVGVSNSPPQVGLDFSAGFASGASGLEKSGRKFLKAKRRK